MQLFPEQKKLPNGVLTNQVYSNCKLSLGRTRFSEKAVFDRVMLIASIANRFTLLSQSYSCISYFVSAVRLLKPYSQYSMVDLVSWKG